MFFKRFQRGYHHVGRGEYLLLKNSDICKNINWVIACIMDDPYFYIGMVHYDFLLHDILHSHLQHSMLYENGDRRSNHQEPVLIGIMRDVVSGVVHLQKLGYLV